MGVLSEAVKQGLHSPKILFHIVMCLLVVQIKVMLSLKIISSRNSKITEKARCSVQQGNSWA